MKKRVQFKRVNDLVKEYVKEGITSYGSIVLPNGNPAVRMGIRFKLANLYVIFDTIEGFYYFGKRLTRYKIRTLLLLPFRDIFLVLLFQMRTTLNYF